MNAMKTMALVGAVIGGLVLWEAFKPEGGVGAVIEGVRSAPRNAGGAGGFASIPLPDGVPAQGVVIFTPQDCPSDAAQRARRLMERLTAEGISWRETSSASFSTLASPDEAQRVMTVMNGPIPIVYVNGRAKAGPTEEEVIAEYRRGRSG